MSIFLFSPYFYCTPMPIFQTNSRYNMKPAAVLNKFKKIKLKTSRSASSTRQIGESTLCRDERGRRETKMFSFDPIFTTLILVLELYDSAKYNFLCMPILERCSTACKVHRCCKYTLTRVIGIKPELLNQFTPVLGQCIDF